SKPTAGSTATPAEPVGSHVPAAARVAGPGPDRGRARRVRQALRRTAPARPAPRADRGALRGGVAGPRPGPRPGGRPGPRPRAGAPGDRLRGGGGGDGGGARPRAGGGRGGGRRGPGGLHRLRGGGLADPDGRPGEHAYADGDLLAGTRQGQGTRAAGLCLDGPLGGEPAGHRAIPPPPAMSQAGPESWDALRSRLTALLTRREAVLDETAAAWARFARDAGWSRADLDALWEGLTQDVVRRYGPERPRRPATLP